MSDVDVTPQTADADALTAPAASDAPPESPIHRPDAAAVGAPGPSSLGTALALLALGMALLGRYLLVTGLPWMALAASLIGIIAFIRLIDRDEAADAGAEVAGAPDRGERSAGRRFRAYLGAVARALDPRDALGAARRMVARSPLTAACVLLSLALSLTVGAVLHSRPESMSFWDVLGLWLLSIGVFLAAAIQSQGWLSRARLAAGLRAYRGALVDAAILFGFALLLRVIGLDRAPDVISGDEGLIGRTARDMMSAFNGHMFGTIYGYGTAYFQLIGLSIAGLGDASVTALRLPSALAGALAAPATYALGRQLFGRRVGLVAGVLLATAHVHLHLSRTAHGQSIDTLTAAMALFAFARGLERRSSAWMAIAGVWLGLAQYGYTAGRLIDLVIFAFVVLVLFLDPARLRGAWLGLATALGAAIVTAAPMIRWVIDRSPEYFDRVDKAGFMQSGELAGRMAETGWPAWLVMSDQAFNAVRAILTVPVTGFYGARIPMLDAIWAVIFVLALGYAVRHLRDWRFLLLVLHVVGGLAVLWLGGLAMLASYRVLGILPSIAVLVAFALVMLVERNLRGLDAPRRLGDVLVGGVVAVAVVYNVGYYFGEYTPSCAYMDPRTAAASIAGSHIAARVGADATVLLLTSAEHDIADHTATRFYTARQAMPVPVTAPDTPSPGAPGDEGYIYMLGEDAGDLPELARAAAPVVVMAGPERAAEIDALALALPGGERSTLSRCGNPVWVVYAVGSPEQP